jgi:hypothetical protein
MIMRMRIVDDIAREGVDPPHQDEAALAGANRCNRVEGVLSPRARQELVPPLPRQACEREAARVTVERANRPTA